MHMNFNGVRLTAKSEGRRIIRVGEKLKLAINLDHLHIFSAETTQAVY